MGSSLHCHGCPRPPGPDLPPSSPFPSCPPSTLFSPLCWPTQPGTNLPSPGLGPALPRAGLTCSQGTMHMLYCTFMTLGNHHKGHAQVQGSMKIVLCVLGGFGIDITVPNMVSNPSFQVLKASLLVFKSLKRSLCSHVGLWQFYPPFPCQFSIVLPV